LKNLHFYRVLTTVGFLCFFFILNAHAQKAPRKLTQTQARDLAVNALDEKSRNLPGLSLEPYVEKNVPDFFSFEALWDNPIPDGSVVVDDLAVDPQTGDVWRRGACKLNSPALKKAQAAVRKRLGLNDKDYKKLQHDGPDC
jgi:hypothetical protein